MILREAMRRGLFPQECLEAVGKDPEIRGRCARCGFESRLGDYVWEGSAWDGLGAWSCPTEGCEGELDDFEVLQVSH